MMGMSELRINRMAEPSAARPLRHAVGAFLSAIGVTGERAEDILMAVGEALANAVEHAYDPAQRSKVELHVQFGTDQSVTIDVFDRGRFGQAQQRPGRGFGLRIVREVACELRIDTQDGTRVRMVFGAAPPAPAPARAASAAR